MQGPMTMNAATVDLFCPACGVLALQVRGGERPIQERKVACPACRHSSRIARLQTTAGDSFQKHVRQHDPNAQVSCYAPHLR